MGKKVSTKGQVTLPKGLRDDLGIAPGDEVDFVKENGTYRVLKVVDFDAFDAAVTKWRGHLKHLKGVDVDKRLREMRGG